MKELNLNNRKDEQIMLLSVGRPISRQQLVSIDSNVVRWSNYEECTQTKMIDVNHSIQHWRNIGGQRIKIILSVTLLWLFYTEIITLCGDNNSDCMLIHLMKLVICKTIMFPVKVNINNYSYFVLKYLITALQNRHL